VTLLQYASFSVLSDVFTPDQITEVLGVEPSRVSWRGSRSSEPFIPKTNIWSFRGTGTGQADEQIGQLLDRFEPMSEQLGFLTANDASTLAMTLVRYFGTPEDSDAYLRRDQGRRFDGVSIEGFHLDVSLLRRLAGIGCPLDVDEYDEYTDG
jgi:hypothetical protein